MISPGLEIKKCTKGFGGLLVKKYLPLYPGLKNIKVILLYHRVLKEPPRKLYDPGLFVTASTFEMHINELSRMFEIVPLEDLTHARNERGRLCAITFDDGWIDNYEVAFPIIKKWGCRPQYSFQLRGLALTAVSGLKACGTLQTKQLRIGRRKSS